MIVIFIYIVIVFPSYFVSKRKITRKLSHFSNPGIMSHDYFVKMPSMQYILYGCVTRCMESAIFII